MQLLARRRQIPTARETRSVEDEDGRIVLRLQVRVEEL